MATEAPGVSQAWSASEYQRHASFVSALAQDLVLELRPQRGERILDLGCGTGELMAVIAESGANVTGIDMSEDMIASARARLPDADLRVMDAHALPFDGEFDAVFSNAALHWMTDPDGVARGIARALRPGGRFVAEFGGAGCVAKVCAALAAELTAIGEDPRAIIRWYFPTIGEYAAVLERAGLSPTMMRLFDRPTPMAGEDGLANWLSVFKKPLVDRLGARSAELLRRVEARARPELYRDGAWVIDYVRLRLTALKP
jgi:trans-aconitate methyltransferase